MCIYTYIHIYVWPAGLDEQHARVLVVSARHDSIPCNGFDGALMQICCATVVGKIAGGCIGECCERLALASVAVTT